MNIPIVVIGSFQILVGSVVLIRLAAATEMFQRNANRQGHPRSFFTRGSVLVGGLAVTAIGIYTLTVGIAG